MIQKINKKTLQRLFNYFSKKIKVQNRLYNRQKLEFAGNYTLIKHIWRYSIGFFLLIIFYILSPAVTVRIGSVRTKTIGDMCITMDYGTYFGSLNKKKNLDLRYFYVKYSGAIANIYLYNLLKKNNLFLSRFYLEPILFYAKRFNRFKRHIIPYYCGRQVLIKPASEWPSPQDWSNIFKSEGLRKYLTFTEDEVSQLKHKIGIRNEKVVGVHIRDSYYDAKTIEDLSRLEKWQFRIENLERFAKQSVFRNSNLLSFIPAIQELSVLNNRFIRFGNNSKIYPQNKINPLIDYANSGLHSAKNDLILISAVEYLICSASGLAHLAHWMRVPVFLMDFSDFFHIPARGITIKSAPIILPKEVRYRKNDKLLSVEEIKNSNVFKLRLPLARDYLLSPNSEIYLSENNSEIIRKSIILGDNYIRGVVTSNEVEFGKESYQRLYNFDSFGLAPILSPYWANLNPKSDNY